MAGPRCRQTRELLGGYKKEQGQLAPSHIEPTAGVQATHSSATPQPTGHSAYMWSQQLDALAPPSHLFLPPPTGARRSCYSRNTHDNDTLPQARPHNRPLTRIGAAHPPQSKLRHSPDNVPLSPLLRGVRISAHLRHRSSRPWAMESPRVAAAGDTRTTESQCSS